MMSDDTEERQLSGLIDVFVPRANALGDGPEASSTERAAN
jgi:hypothetical protein